MSRLPELSFVVPAYNCEDVVGEAIDSALQQTLEERAEVVAVDDGSSDGTFSVLSELAERHPGRVRIERMPQNQGGGAARNCAIAAAQGRLIYMLDADNVLPQGVVEKQLARLREGRAQAVSVESVRFFRHEDKTTVSEWKMAGEKGLSTLRSLFDTDHVPASHGNYLFTRELHEAVGGYEEDRGAMDAWSFGFKHLAQGRDVALTPGTHYLHRIDRPGHPSYWTRDETAGRNDRNALAVVRRYVESLPSDLATKVASLPDDAPFHELIRRGAFHPDTSVSAMFTQMEQIGADRSAPRSKLSGLLTWVRAKR
jgi:glycosyltransferase involved in cell wall biosynthesis